MKVKVVPCEADDAMWKAGGQAFYESKEDVLLARLPVTYTAMLSASPDTGYVPVKREDAKWHLHALKHRYANLEDHPNKEVCKEAAAYRQAYDHLRKALESGE